MNRNHRYAGVFAILLLPACLAAPPVLAAEATVNTQQDAGIVFTMIILLLCAVAAALFFASPLRKRFTGEDREPEREPDLKPQQDQPTPAALRESSTSTAPEPGLWWGQPPDPS